MNPTPVNSCTGNFFDSGGSFNNYSANEDIIKTICPAGTSGTHIEIQFLTTDFGSGDDLCIYDGTSINAEEIFCSSNDVDNPDNGAFKVSSSAPNTSGCLTLRFTSNAVGAGSGWEAIINCVPACQRVIAELASSAPASDPVDNGWIDICPGDNVEFVARGNYPQNGFSYFQNDATSKFSWDFGDGTIGFGPNVTHTYQRSGGYTVQLVIEDIQGCTNDNVISQRVRVATRPTFGFDAVFPDQVCADDTLTFLNNITQSDSHITATPNEGKFDVRSGNVDSIPLPDGVNVAYESPVTFSEFIPGAIITNKNQIKNICINIEHSYLRDLDISIKCPNDEVMRLDTTNAAFTLEMFLGIPFEGDDDIPGNLDPPVPGIGFTYCFTPTPQFGTFFDQALSQPARTSLPEGTYKPIDDFNTLLGCPVNGEWTLIVEDKIKRDNGWLFSWSICFVDELRPPVETFTPGIVDWGFLDNGTMLHNDQDSMVTVPSSAGTTNYVFQITDEFGCMFDTTLSYSVVAPTDPSCFQCDEVVGDAPDVGLCENETVQLMVDYLGFDENTIPFENNTVTEFGNATHPPSAPLVSEIAVAGAEPATITNPALDIASICIDIDTDATGDLEIYLEAPTGEILELSSNNGGTGDNFRNTCFIADPGLQNITGASAPYTGNFLPEASFNVLNGAQVNGKWTLRISDGFGPLEKNILNSWSISFNVENTPVYSWTPTQGLSCTDCPDPIASPTTTTEYIATVSDDFGCIGFDTILVSIVPSLEAPVVTIDDPAEGILVFEWMDIPNAISYEININNGGWFPPNNGSLSHFISGLSDGDPVNFKVRGITDVGSCPRGEACVEVIYGECLLTVNPIVFREISCFGAADATIIAEAMNDTGPTMFTLNDTLTQELSIFSNIGPGTHTVVVEDFEGCIDTVFFDIQEPDPIVIDTMVVDVSCNGADDGQLIATATGGVGDLRFLWATSPSTFSDTATGQGPGTYTVEVTDENNCRETATATIVEPDEIVITFLGFEPSCNGGTDGRIITTVMGGVEPYTYEWDIPAFTADVMDVGAGTHTVTVTDANMCEATNFIVITQPAPGMATAVGTDASCHNTTDGSATIDLVGTGPFTFLWDDPAMQTTQTAVDLSPGVYNFTITDSDGCNSVGFVGIGAPVEVQSSISTTRTSCFGGDDGTASVLAIGGITPYTYLWNDEAMQTASTATGLIAGDYEVIITDGRGCSTTASATVGTATQIETIVDSTFASCIENEDGTATVFATGGTGSFSYEWSDDLNQMASRATDLAVGTYTVTVTDANNCSVTDMVEVIAGDPVRIDSIVGTRPSCFGDRDGALVGFISGGEAPYTYLWDDPNEQFFNPATMLLAGDYTLTVTDVNGCTAVRDVTLNQPDSLEIELSAVQVDCFGADNGVITAAVTGGTFPYTYRLDNVPVSDSIINNLSIGTYVVEVRDRNDCRADATIEITQPDEPLSFTLMQVDTSCVDANMSSVELIASGGTGPDYSYEWSATSVDSSFIDNLAAEMLFVTVTDENSCTLVDSILIMQYDTIFLELISNSASCAGFPDGAVAVNLVTGGAGQDVIENYSYSWEGFPEETSNILLNVPGNMEYTVTVTDAQGCTAVGSRFVGEPDQISLGIEKEDPSCFGVADGFVRVASVNFPVTSYEWSTGPDDVGPEINGLGGGNYIVTVTVASGCSAVTSVQLNEPALLTNSLDFINNVCSGDADASISALPMGGTPPFNYAWSNAQTTATISNLRDGDFRVTITDSNGCTVIDSVTLLAPAAIFVETEVENITCFEGSDGSFTLTTTGGVEPYQYSYDGEFFTNQNIRSGLETGAYPVTVMDDQGCSWDTIIQIGTVPQFELFAGEDQFINIGDSISLTATLFNAVGVPDIVWTGITDIDLSCMECVSTTVSPLNTATYEVYGIDENGCETTDLVQVFVARQAQVVVPTGFTPNNDGNNDLLVVHGKSSNILNINSFQIYDRWGETVYERNDFNINDRTVGWDGTFRGQEMEAGTYIWTLQVRFENGETENLQGATTLIR